MNKKLHCDVHAAITAGVLAAQHLHLDKPFDIASSALLELLERGFKVVEDIKRVRVVCAECGTVKYVNVKDFDRSVPFRCTRCHEQRLVKYEDERVRYPDPPIAIDSVTGGDDH